MNATDRMLDARWLESGFPVAFVSPVPARGYTECQLEAMKDRLLRPFIETVAGVNDALARELRWAANEAAALAWFTACPVLVFPILLEEKVRAALLRWEKQERLLKGVPSPA